MNQFLSILFCQRCSGGRNRLCHLTNTGCGLKHRLLNGDGLVSQAPELTKRCLFDLGKHLKKDCCLSNLEKVFSLCKSISILFSSALKCCPSSSDLWRPITGSWSEDCQRQLRAKFAGQEAKRE